MTDNAMLTITTELDPSGFKDVEKAAAKTFGEVKKEIENVNKTAKIAPEVDGSKVKRGLGEIEKDLKKLNQERAQILVTMPKSPERDKEFARISKQIQDLTKEKKEIKLAADTKAAEDSLAQMFDKIGKGEIQIDIDKKALDKQIKALDTQLKELSKRRDILVSMPKNPQRDKELEKLDRKIKDITQERKIKLELQSKGIKDADAKLAGLVKTLGIVSVAVTAAAGAFTFLAVKVAGSLDHIDKSSQKLGLSIEKYQELSYIASQSGTSVDGLTRSMRTLAIQAEAGNKTFQALGVNVKDANGNFKNQEELLYEVIGALQQYPEGVERAKAANELLGMTAAELAPLLNAGVGSLEELTAKAREYGLILDGSVVKAGADAVSAFDTMKRSGVALLQNALAPALPAITDLAYSIATLMKDLRPLAETVIPAMVQALSVLITVLPGVAAGFATYAAGTALAAVGSKAVALGISGIIAKMKALTIAMMKNPITLLAVAVAALVTWLVQTSKSWDHFVARVKYGALAMLGTIYGVVTDIGLVWIKLKATIIKAALEIAKAIVDYLFVPMEGFLSIMSKLPGGVGDMFESANNAVTKFKDGIIGGLDDIQDGIDKAIAAAIVHRNKNQAIYAAELADARQAVAEAKRIAEEKAKVDELIYEPPDLKLNLATKAEHDRLAALEARYAAQVKIARATITDEEELRAALLEIDKDYYAEKQKLVEESFRQQIIKGRELNAEQIALLQELQRKNKELAAQDDSITVLEKVYQARVAIANRTIDDEEAREAELLALRKKYLAERLELLLKEAETAIMLGKEVSADTIDEINRLRAELKGLGGGLLAELQQMLQDFSEFVGGLVDSLTSFLSDMYSNRISALEARHEQELRLIEDRLAAETAMYEAQLEEFADLDERREELAEEHAQRMEELNWKQQEHITEDQYRALKEQMEEEEARYAESIAALEEDVARREEIKLAQEMAEAEALARKEQLEREYAIRRAQMERKQAIADKANAMFSAAINTALAVVRALKDHPFPYSSIVAGIMAAAGAVQLAAIASRPLPAIPSFYKGGEIKGKNKDQYRHIPQPDNPYDNVLMWGREGERVLDLKESAAYKKIQAMGLTLADILNAPPVFALPDGGTYSPAASDSHNSTVINSHMHITARETLTPLQARRLAEKQARMIARKQL